MREAGAGGGTESDNGRKKVVGTWEGGEFPPLSDDAFAFSSINADESGEARLTRMPTAAAPARSP